MCPPALHPPPNTILNGADKEVIMFLDRQRHGNPPLPENVIDYVNPYQYDPSKLPGGLWYLVRSTEKKETESGFWREKGAAFEIYTNSTISGMRTTLEFIEVRDAREQKTNWVMQEYKITDKGLCVVNKQKESRVICRVFLLEVQSSSTEMGPDSKKSIVDCRNHISSVTSVVQSTGSTSKQGSRSESPVNDAANGKRLLFEADSLSDALIRDILEHDALSDGDFLELDDLVGGSPSSSSDNSSHSSLSLDEYFDADALLQELHDKNNQGIKEKDSNSKFSVTASVRPCEVVMQPPALGSLVCASGRQLPVGCKTPSSISKKQNVGERNPDHTIKMLKGGGKDDGPSSSSGVASSSNRSISMSKGKEKAAAGLKTKSLKKYFCFMSF